jgi:glucose-specific phosphotransferase system IIA component
VDISIVPDEVFSKKILGDGFAVIPSDNNFFSPASGTISDVTETLHAYCITTDDGLELLVHIGIDTVNLKGKGFTSHVKNGDRIKLGDPLASADLKLIESSGYNTTSMVVVTNTELLRSFKVIESPSANAGDKALIYKF